MDIEQVTEKQTVEMVYINGMGFPRTEVLRVLDLLDVYRRVPLDNPELLGVLVGNEVVCSETRNYAYRGPNFEQFRNIVINRVPIKKERVLVDRSKLEHLISLAQTVEETGYYVSLHIAAKRVEDTIEAVVE